MVRYSIFTSPCTKGCNFSFCCSVTSASISRSDPRVRALAITSSNRTCQMASLLRFLIIYHTRSLFANYVFRCVFQNVKKQPFLQLLRSKNGCFRWCGQQDSNLHALAGEPKGDVTSGKACVYAILLSSPIKPTHE